MRVLFGAQDVLNLVNNSYTLTAENAIEVQINAQREITKKDHKAMLYIHQCVDPKVFEKIVDSTTVKAVCDTLVQCYDGDISVKKVKLQSLRKQYENLSIKNNEKVTDYISRVIVVTNEMKSCGETYFELVIIEKVLRSLTPLFDYIVIAIEHSKETSTALKAYFVNKNKKQAWLENRKKNGEGVQKPKLSNPYDTKHKNVHKGKEKFDDRKIWCYNCNKFGYFGVDCSPNKVSKGEEANIARGDFEDEPVLLMESENAIGIMVDLWYMNTGCSNHLTVNKQ
ncbi:uncharacterized protein LOC127079338 [Lathyrus oleraceus]|uniref:uncharacterized protein LOC127079338 n=1 Tax=Pisum sativum TaxID=3888 RepID=UPI0021D30396|nr:uncharacterized protein LOC127079338 [Pisum sativum]